jgi:predicted Rossmann-fold nucleotide-binding protein
MKVIIAGGRDYILGADDLARLDRELGLEVSLVISGGARGVDTDGENWAKSRGIPVERHEARWKELGKKAGPIRNEEMARRADMVVLFPGGKGTGSMARLAAKYELKILDWR